MAENQFSSAKQNADDQGSSSTIARTTPWYGKKRHTGTARMNSDLHTTNCFTAFDNMRR